MKGMGGLGAILISCVLLVGCASFQSRNPELVMENSIGMKLRYIEPGSFIMGSDKGFASSEAPAHRITLTQPYYMGVYEVTQGEWMQVMDENPSKFPELPEGSRHRPSSLALESSNYPIESMTWLEAKEFCRRLSAKEGRTYRLPTEEEWEYAYRAGTTTSYYWGNTFDGRYAWWCDNSGRHSHEVGQKLPNAWGLYDMAGNLWEYCENDFQYRRYDRKEEIDIQVASEDNGKMKTRKGGVWKCISRYCRAAERAQREVHDRASTTGFRVIIEM